jgi:hypothetical protein
VLRQRCLSLWYPAHLLWCDGNQPSFCATFSLVSQCHLPSTIEWRHQNKNLQQLYLKPLIKIWY